MIQQAKQVVLSYLYLPSLHVSTLKTHPCKLSHLKVRLRNGSASQVEKFQLKTPNERPVLNPTVPPAPQPLIQGDGHAITLCTYNPASCSQNSFPHSHPWRHLQSPFSSRQVNPNPCDRLFSTKVNAGDSSTAHDPTHPPSQSTNLSATGPSLCSASQFSGACYAYWTV